MAAAALACGRWPSRRTRSSCRRKRRSASRRARRQDDRGPFSSPTATTSTATSCVRRRSVRHPGAELPPARSRRTVLRQGRDHRGEVVVVLPLPETRQASPWCWCRFAGLRRRRRLLSGVRGRSSPSRCPAGKGPGPVEATPRKKNWFNFNNCAPSAGCSWRSAAATAGRCLVRRPAAPGRPRPARRQRLPAPPSRAPALCPDAGRQGAAPRPVARQGDGREFLGDLVRAVPRGDARVHRRPQASWGKGPAIRRHRRRPAGSR